MGPYADVRARIDQPFESGEYNNLRGYTSPQSPRVNGTPPGRDEQAHGDARRPQRLQPRLLEAYAVQPRDRGDNNLTRLVRTSGFPDRVARAPWI